MSGVYGRPVVIEWNIYVRSHSKKLSLKKRQIKRKIPLGSKTKNRQPFIRKKYMFFLLRNEYAFMAEAGDLRAQCHVTYRLMRNKCISDNGIPKQTQM